MLHYEYEELGFGCWSERGVVWKNARCWCDWFRGFKEGGLEGCACRYDLMVNKDRRSVVWKLLLKYSPTNKENRETVLQKKRDDYFTMVNTYIEKPTL